jgi:CBS domain containing-hemolysin-like protein
MSLLEVGLLAALVGCFVGASILAAAEVSIIRVRRSEVLAEVESGAPRSGRLLQLIDDLPRVLNTILLVVLLLQLSAAAIGGILADRWFGGLGVTLATIILTAVLFIYAEAIPKTRAMQAPYRTALRLAPVLAALVRLLWPVVASLVWLADIQTSGDANFGAATEQEIRAMARESAEAGAIEPDDAELVNRSFEFNDRSVAEVMVERDRIAAVGHDESVADVLARAIALGHRRLPVHRNGLDDITGVVRLRDVAATAVESPDAEVASIMSGVLRCRPGEPISDLLARMQRHGLWIAIITDESGSTLGLATVEDLVAELVGEIEDVQVARRPDMGTEQQ